MLAAMYSPLTRVETAATYFHTLLISPLLYTSGSCIPSPCISPSSNSSSYSFSSHSIPLILHCGGVSLPIKAVGRRRRGRVMALRKMITDAVRRRKCKWRYNWWWHTFRLARGGGEAGGMRGTHGIRWGWKGAGWIRQAVWFMWPHISKAPALGCFRTITEEQ